MTGVTRSKNVPDKLEIPASSFGRFGSCLAGRFHGGFNRGLHGHFSHFGHFGHIRRFGFRCLGGLGDLGNFLGGAFPSTLRKPCWNT